MTAPSVRVAVVGCGDISSLHLAAIAARPTATLVAVCDVHQGRLTESSRIHAVPGFSDFDDMLATAAPDVVHICTPHHLHAPMAVAALQRGIHVVLEKPLAHSREEGRRIIAAAEASGARIGICLQNRYNASTSAAAAVLASGELGQVLGASATVIWSRTADYYLDRPWRGRWASAGGGLLMNQAIHTLDLLQWLVGPVAGVSGHAATRALADVIEVEDTAELVLEHVRGMRSVFFATNAHAVNAPVVIDIVLERGSLRIAGDLIVTRADGSTETVAEQNAPTGARSYWGVSHERLINDFYDTLDSPEPFWISPEEAYISLDIIQQVYDQSYPERALPAEENHPAAGRDARPAGPNEQRKTYA
ncbi:dehydrogenase [Subtercola boreus]|uniref:Dehydrogenase n=1 Tax=Subtercola boreus TaxID=120213 RepID=A0A3E0VDY8_9MICO|nr:Gfo/Idh/MocA family oxidoreductase [Subtercola boreus]RFA08134.1 dehydrogenase [Subtercola boreus]TQL54978.1 putative dehydrogenase [Subtercola boreus]